MNNYLIWIIILSVFTSCSTQTSFQTSTRNVETLMERANFNENTEFHTFHTVENIQIPNLQELAPVPNTSSSQMLADITNGLINEAKTFIGTPYRYGGTTRRGIDCSAFVQQVFGAHNIDLPRVSTQMARLGETVKKDDLRSGDLVFFSTTRRGISHVGIVIEAYEGEIKFIHAASSKGVVISSLDETYWNRAYRTAKRLDQMQLDNFFAVN
ncbi:MAG: C40 family peptidase [Weeksellaceae bacterium]|nr:C40 family peptidase [Weeksellaceae bacterium]